MTQPIPCMCGGEAVQVGMAAWTWVRCTHCGMSGPQRLDYEQALEDWNCVQCLVKAARDYAAAPRGTGFQAQYDPPNQEAKRALLDAAMIFATQLLAPEQPSDKEAENHGT